MNSNERFFTISELEILSRAYDSILEDCLRAEENYRKTCQNGFPNEKYNVRASKLRAQLNELSTSIDMLELVD